VNPVITSPYHPTIYHTNQSMSGFRSLCIHYPHLKDVFEYHLLEFILPSPFVCGVWHALTRVEYHRRMYALRTDMFTYTDFARYQPIRDGRIRMRVADVVGISYNAMRWSAEFLPPEFGHYNTICSYVGEDDLGRWWQQWELRRFVLDSNSHVPWVCCSMFLQDRTNRPERSIWATDGDTTCHS
jgi:hypothetical protein